MPINPNKEKGRLSWNEGYGIKPTGVAAAFDERLVDHWDIEQVADCLVENDTYEGYSFDPRYTDEVIRDFARYDAESLIMQRQELLDQRLGEISLAKVRYIA